MHTAEVGQLFNGVFTVKMYLFSCDCVPPVAIALDLMCDGNVDCLNATDEISPFCSGHLHN